MSKLNFASVSEAYSIGSEQIKNTQTEIAKLKKIIEESATKKPESLPEQKNVNSNLLSNNEGYSRIGNPDNVQANFCNNPRLPQYVNHQIPHFTREQIDHEIPMDDFDYTFLKIMRHPRFDEIVKNYVIINHPDWILNNTHYVPNNNGNPNYYRSKESFGSNEELTKNYVIFFIVAIMMYLGMCIVLKK
jgi:hypothetical protein